MELDMRIYMFWKLDRASAPRNMLQTRMLAQPGQVAPGVQSRSPHV
jgi:hypothetical protein